MELERLSRLSQSVLWDLQKLAYSEFGPLAWGEKGVPFYLTSNPLIAKQFTACILSYLRDRILHDKPASIDQTQPFYLFDLGAGSGRLGYLILKSLIPAVRETLSKDLKLCYVMTDMVDSNLEFLKNHSYLKPFIESGNLDFANYTHTSNTPLILKISGTKLDPSTVVNPIGLICTYYFDTLPQDLFKAKGGKLEEGRITLEVKKAGTEGSGKGKLSPEMIPNLSASFSYREVKNPENYYPGIPELNNLLLNYTALFENSPFLFPIGGFESLKYFSNLAKGRMLLLAGDQGVATEQDVREWGEPAIFKHASFSMAVSYHLLSLYFMSLGGAAFLTELPHPKYVIISATLGADSTKCPNLSWTFHEEFDLLEPVDYWHLTDLPSDVIERLTLRQLILLVKLGAWDSVNFHSFFGTLMNKLSGIDEREIGVLKTAIYNVWENFYPVSPKEGDFVMNLGVLLFFMKLYEDALFFFLKAKSLSGEKADLLMNISHCYRLLGEHDLAEQNFHRASTLKAQDMSPSGSG